MISICHALLGEHGVFYRQFDYIQKMIDESQPLAQLVGATRPLVDALISHALIENDTIIPAIESVFGPNGPAATMRFDHEEIDEGFQNLLTCDSREDFVNRYQQLIELTRDHFAKEEQALFVMAKELLQADQLQELGARWSEQRQVSVR